MTWEDEEEVGEAKPTGKAKGKPTGKGKVSENNRFVYSVFVFI